MRSWFGPCRHGTVRLPVLGACGSPISGVTVPPRGDASELQIIPAVEVSGQGKYHAKTVEVDYHIGLVHFQEFNVDALTICVKGPFVRCR